jgi:hypothetical protein
MDDEIVEAVTRRFRSMRRPNRYEQVTHVEEGHTLIRSATRPTPEAGVIVKKAIRIRRRRKGENRPAGGEKDAENMTAKERKMAVESLSTFNLVSASAAPSPLGQAPPQPDTL